MDFKFRWKRPIFTLGRFFIEIKRVVREIALQNGTTVELLLLQISLVVGLVDPADDVPGVHLSRYVLRRGAVGLPDIEHIIVIGAGQRMGTQPKEVRPGIEMGQGQGKSGALLRSKGSDLVHPARDVREPCNTPCYGKP